MTPRQIRHIREAERFMPRLWAFAYPMKGRSYRKLRTLAFRAWAFAFHCRVRSLDL